MNGDLPLWLDASPGGANRAAASRLLAPDFRMEVGPFVLGPLLARTWRGGLFTVIDGGEQLPRVAIELSTSEGDGRVHDGLVAAISAAGKHGLVQAHATGSVGRLRWAMVERVQGWPLRLLIGRRGLTFTGRRVAALGAELADVLAALSAASPSLPLVHGRLGVGHIIIDVTGRARLCGSPVLAGSPGVIPDAIGLGATLAATVLGVAPDPRGLTMANVRSLAAALERPEHQGRISPGLRRLILSLLSLHPRGFLPSMAVLRDEFAALMEGLPVGVADPQWGRALNDAVRGVPQGHRATLADAEGALQELARCVPSLEQLVRAACEARARSEEDDDHDSFTSHGTPKLRLTRIDGASAPREWPDG